jgi:hypothetical protein
MPPVGFKPAIPARERRQTQAVDGAATASAVKDNGAHFQSFFLKFFHYVCILYSLSTFAWKLSVRPTYIATLIEALAHFVCLHVLKLSGLEINGDLFA